MMNNIESEFEGTASKQTVCTRAHRYRKGLRVTLTVASIACPRQPLKGHLVLSSPAIHFWWESKIMVRLNTVFVWLEHHRQKSNPPPATEISSSLG